LKDEFLSLLSHELRTPLNAILGWARVLGTQRNEDLQKRAVEVIERNAGLQARLIEELLDMSRILTGKMVQQTGPVDLNAIVDSAANSVRPAAAAKAIALDFSIDDSARSISGDPDRLQQVVWNLLSNAIKFTPSGGRVELRAQKDGI
jgi:signal transduction histidine kinase